MAEREFDLMLAGKRKSVVWQGANGINAAHRYVDAHPGTTVVAWRECIRTNIIAQWGDGMRIID